MASLKLDFDIEEILDSVKKESISSLEAEEYDIECPHCGKNLSVSTGISKCPYCKNDIDVGLDIEFN